MKYTTQRVLTEMCHQFLTSFKLIQLFYVALYLTLIYSTLPLSNSSSSYLCSLPTRLWTLCRCVVYMSVCKVVYVCVAPPPLSKPPSSPVPAPNSRQPTTFQRSQIFANSWRENSLKLASNCTKLAAKYIK